MQPLVQVELALIRNASAVLEWFGINEERVDLVVSSERDQWRIVYFTTDDTTIDSISVFRRPRRFDGVDRGTVVVVNGASGSGKSSLLEAIAAASELPWVLLDEPVIGSVDQAYLIWRDQAPVLHAGFLDAIAALARRGNLVAVSAAGHPAELVNQAFEGLSVFRVGLDCDITTLVARERGRAGRWGGLAAGSTSVHNGWTYDARFDTTHTPAATIARSVLDLVNATPSAATR